MKKITSNNTFDFRLDGQTVLTISPEGVIASDDQAAFIFNRLGAQVFISDVDVDTEIEKVIAPEETPKVEEVTPEVETTPEAPVEETPVVDAEVAPEQEIVSEEAPKVEEEATKTE